MTPPVPPGRHTFVCLDGHTAGNPVRLVIAGAPSLHGATMSARRADFIQNWDWVRRALMWEPRGHDLMSGAILYPALDESHDAALLFIEVDGCLPMCGHVTIGVVTFLIEKGLVAPREPGRLVLATPAGLISATYREEGGRVREVRFVNVPSYLAAAEVKLDVPGLGELVVDIAYGGNFYAIVEPQKNYAGLDQLSPEEILRLSPLVRRAARAALTPVHPEDPTISGVTHVMWTGAPRHPRAQGRNAVFYGERAIDRSPCGTGTSARLAQLAAKGRLRPGEAFIHESLIGTLFAARIEEELRLGPYPAIRPSVAGSAHLFGFNTLFVDPADPLGGGFSLWEPGGLPASPAGGGAA